MGSGVVCAQPWTHAEFSEFLPREMAEYVAAQWPVDGYMWLKHSDIVQPDGTSLRRYQPIAAAFPEVAAWLLSDALRDELCRLLDIESQPLYPQALLIEDMPGYWIRRHTDCNGKSVSAQVYLAEDARHESRGVILQTMHGERMKQIPYRFNYGYAFKVTRDSWHRVVRADTGRRSIQLIYYDTPTPKL